MGSMGICLKDSTIRSLVVELPKCLIKAKIMEALEEVMMRIRSKIMLKKKTAAARTLRHPANLQRIQTGTSLH